MICVLNERFLKLYLLQPIQGNFYCFGFKILACLYCILNFIVTSVVDNYKYGISILSFQLRKY